MAYSMAKIHVCVLHPLLLVLLLEFFLYRFEVDFVIENYSFLNMGHSS